MINRSIVILVISLGLASCVSMDDDVLPRGTGRSGDLVVVMDSVMWSGRAGQALLSCFAATQDGLPQPEPYFNVIQVTPPNFKQIFKTTKNIIVVAKSGDASSKYSIDENIWAKNQLVLTLLVESNEKAGEILSKNCQSLRDEFRNIENQRLQGAFLKLRKEKTVSEVEEVVSERFIMPSDYIIAKKQAGSIWLRKDFVHQGHQVNMGLLIYKTAYTSQAQFETDRIMSMRDSLSKMVEGPSPNSYMKHFEEYRPISRELTINKRFVKEFRGLWNMENAFMGGPFIQYAFISEDGANLICVDGYVFAPKFDKREYLRELEAIALSPLQGRQ